MGSYTLPASAQNKQAKQQRSQKVQYTLIVIKCIRRTMRYKLLSKALAVFPVHLLLLISYKALLNMSEKGKETRSAFDMQDYVTSNVQELKFNRPFHATIYSEAADTILFMARVMDPSLK
ncbi:alpha-1-antiproteinase F-like [Mixophyes fleayi]|uniref:alpha-1-antiproteinase F-like n=1 Tax=Mixophyes fleayi TaxID=3061075 RepID=UPI003F4DD9E0